MKRLILLELILLFLATTFQSDSTGGWVQQTLPVNKTINDIYFTDSLNGWCVTTGGNSSTDTGYVMKTTNGGTNWIIQYQAVAPFYAIQFVGANTGYTIGYDINSGRGTIYKSTNTGTNWFVVNNSLIAVYRDLSFVNKDTGWVCIDNGFDPSVLKTTDGGVSLLPQLSQSFQIIKLFFINKDTGWAASNEANTKLYRTTNGGTNWNLQFTFTNNVSRSLVFTTRDTGYINGLYKTTNGGFNWTAMNNGQGGSGMSFINSVTGYSCAGFSVMQKTIDGLNWFNQNVPAGGWLAVQFTDSLKGWAGGVNLIHTTDGGGPPVGIHQISNEIPWDFALYQNSPNPFNPSTNIKYQITKNIYVKLIVYDISGKEIVDLVNQRQIAGTYEVDFNANGLASGIYFYSLIIDGNITDTKKMILLK